MKSRKPNNFPPTFFEPIIKKRIHQVYDSKTKNEKEGQEQCHIYGLPQKKSRKS